MINALTLSLRRFIYLVRLELREARALIALVIAVCLALRTGLVWFEYQRGFGPTFKINDAIVLGMLSFAASLPVLADVFAGSGERCARSAIASQAVSSVTMYLAKVCAVAMATAAIYLTLCAASALTVAALVSPSAALPAGGSTEVHRVAHALVESGVLVLALAAVAVTSSVALVFRHALAATVAGWATIAALFAMHFDTGALKLGTRLASLSAETTQASASPWTYAVLFVAFGCACRLRGRASRSWWTRSWRIALVLGLSSGAAAGAMELREWRRATYEFNDPGAYISCGLPDVSGDGMRVVLKLSKDDVETGWYVDLVSLKAQRITSNNLEFLDDPMLSPFDRGLKRQRIRKLKEFGRVGGEFFRPAWEERWTSKLNQVASTVEEVHVIPPRRRLPEVAYYLDLDQRIHSVDLPSGTDTATPYRVDGEAPSFGVDEEGRWATWSDSDLHFRAVELATGQEVTYEQSGSLGRVIGGFLLPSFEGRPVLRCLNDHGSSHATIHDGKVVALPLARRYDQLVDVDGNHLIGISEENGLYLIGPGCEEIAVLREPMPAALPTR